MKVKHGNAGNSDSCSKKKGVTSLFLRPIFFGPRYSNSHEAEELINDGGGFKIDSGTDLYLGVKKLFDDDDKFFKALLMA